MREFFVKLNSVGDVWEFVRAATVQPYDIFVGGYHEYVSAQSFIGMFGLDLRGKLRVTMYCGDTSTEDSRQLVQPYIVAA